VYSSSLKEFGALMQTIYLVGEALGLSICALSGGQSSLFVSATDLEAGELPIGEILVGRGSGSGELSCKYGGMPTADRATIAGLVPCHKGLSAAVGALLDSRARGGVVDTTDFRMRVRLGPHAARRLAWCPLSAGTDLGIRA
jgi:hypothetical protein